MKKIVVLVLVAALIFAAAMLLKKRKNAVAEAPTATPPSYRVKTVTAQSRTLQETGSFLAKLEAEKSISLSSKLSGRIMEVLVRESQQVNKGDLLVRIDDAEISATINSLQVTLAALENEAKYSRDQYERNVALYRAGGLAREKLDASEVAAQSRNAALQSTRQKIKALQAQLDYLIIRAPFSGTVGTIFLRQGDLAVAGRPLLLLHSPRQKLTFSYVPETNTIAVDQDVLLDKQKIGRITTLYPDGNNGLSVAEVALDTLLARPNESYLTIEVVTRVETGCTLPVNALLHQQEGVVVMVHQDGHFASVPVTVKAQNSQYALIDPCVSLPVAVATETKLSLLPTLGNVSVDAGSKNE